MSNISPIQIVRDFLSSLREEDLYIPLRDLFTLKGYRAWITHGTHELGKDLIATDGISNLLINVKKGDIGQAKWKSDVHPSLTDLMQTPVIHTRVDKSLPKKPILIFSGEMTTYLDQKVDYFNDYYSSKGDPKIEVWDIDRLASEFNDHVFGITLVQTEYLEDFNRIILSITENSIDMQLVEQFIHKHLDIKKNFLPFRILFISVLRRAELRNNVYSFFNFAEFALIHIWFQIFKSQDFSDLHYFDELHNLYISRLESWITEISERINTKFGLFDQLHGGISEVGAYPLRTFEIIRRVSYLAYVFFVQNEKDKALTYVEVLQKVIENNNSSSTPLCEMNYNDISLALTVLLWGKKKQDARVWLFNLMDFLVSHYGLGYGLAPLDGKKECNEQAIFKAIFEKADQDNIKSYVIPLTIEFAVLFDAREIFDVFSKNFSQFDNMLHELIMPEESNEIEIYEKNYLNSVEILLPVFRNFDLCKNSYYDRIDTWKRNYSPVVHHRQYILALLAAVYKDRFFQDTWRSVSID